MNKPRLVISDLHCNSWSQFATTNADGVNSRLQHILDELDRACDALASAGGDQVIIAGDLFHVRGAIHPEVFNPVAKKFDNLVHQGFTFYACTGNHDLAGRETTEIGNAFQSLGHLNGFNVITMPKVFDDMAFIPWTSDLNLLRKLAQDLALNYDASNTDLFIHAGMSGVLPGLDIHALDPKEVAGWGFRRVFAGHFHNHVAFDGGVYSIGALTHQTWSDVGTKAGFLIIDDASVKYHASHAPSFVDLDGEMDPADMAMLVDGNYVRVRGLKLTDKEINELRNDLMDMGAKGVSIQVARELASTRGTTAPAKAPTLVASIQNYIDSRLGLNPQEAGAVNALCQDILTDVTV